MIRVVYLLFLLILSRAYAQKEYFFINRVDLFCDLVQTCDLLKPRFLEFQGKEYNARNLKYDLKSRLFEHLIDSFEYVVEQNDLEVVLKITLTSRKVINSIKIVTGEKGVPLEGVLSLLPVKEGNYYNSDMMSQLPGIVSKYLFDLGIANSVVKITHSQKDKLVDVIINVVKAKIIRIKKIKIFYTEKENIDFIKSKIFKLGGKIFNRKEINLMVTELTGEIFRMGYPFSFLKLRPTGFSEDKAGVILEFDLNLGERVLFNISGNISLSRSMLIGQVKDKLKDQGNIDQNQIKKIIQAEIDEAYSEIGLFNTKTRVDYLEGFSNNHEKVKTFIIRVKEGHKVKIADIIFSGNRYFKGDLLKNIYLNQGSPLAKNNYLDISFLEKYKQLIFENYLKFGFVNAEITDPKVIFTSSRTAVIKIGIKELKQVYLSEIIYPQGVTLLFKEELKKITRNKVGDPLNILALDADLEEVERFLRNKGYPFAKIRNKESESIISYLENFTKAILFLDVDPGKKSFFNNLFLAGNIRTKEEVFKRELFFEKGELLTLEKINSYIDRISSTGLFKEVKVHPRPVEGVKVDEGLQLVDLVVEVVERDFASLELGPGFRTDLGIRLAAKFKMINLSGLGRRLSFRGELNQRLDENSALAPARQGEVPLAFLEYFVDGRYEEPHLAGGPIGMDLISSVGRRRYRTFDSDIFLSGITLSEASTWFVPLIRYQYEYDRQYDALYEKDQGRFKIGSITPSLSFDLRDRRINPSKGLFLSLIGEYASPALGSIDANNYKINFFSIITRNNFYYPFAHNWVAAMYLSAGYQKNLETALLVGSDGNPVLDENGIPTTIGYIPTVKVFRLEGSDNVRGWRNTEINTLSNGKDIAEVVVNGTAYYLNIKLEGRHYLGDNIVVYPFFDAGSIQVDQWVPFQLKTAVGLGVRYLTPMGSLELDFGIKTKRGAGESFGTINLMIGYF